MWNLLALIYFACQSMYTIDFMYACRYAVDLVLVLKTLQYDLYAYKIVLEVLEIIEDNNC